MIGTGLISMVLVITNDIRLRDVRSQYLENKETFCRGCVWVSHGVDLIGDDLKWVIKQVDEWVEWYYAN